MTTLLGVDVGGTHTDAVLVGDDGVIAEAKVETDAEHLMQSVLQALESVQQEGKGVPVDRFSLSTTLCTNAIVQGRTEPVGVLVSAGPGVDPSFYAIGEHYQRLRGGLDHRGAEVTPLDDTQVKKAVKAYRAKGLKSFAVVGKFSPRNPQHEQAVARVLKEEGSEFHTLGHTLSGQLNFPRRIATAYYNSAVWRLYNGFADAVAASCRELGLAAPLHILKADGGTMTLEHSRLRPVETILSGPAASVMGIIALCRLDQDCVLLDVGGTTTDIAIFASGAPVLDRDGTEIEGRPTLVRALKTRSIGIGGDSAVSVVAGGLRVGPERRGKCLAMNGPAPALTDALNVLGLSQYGDAAASLAGLEEVGRSLEIPAREAARRVVEQACATIQKAVEGMLSDINSRPVYTVHELLEERRVAPGKLYLMGGPARSLGGELSKVFGLEAIVPEHSAVANAIGAALARPTLEVELFADTARKKVFIPSMDVARDISAGYSLADARLELETALQTSMRGLGLDPGEAEIVEESAMNMVRDYVTVGQDIRVKGQVKPGISTAFSEVIRCLC